MITEFFINALIENDFRYPVIVTNCDTMIMENYEQIMEHHMESENDLTIVSSLKNTVIPYGVLKAKEHGLIISIYKCWISEKYVFIISFL